MTSSSPTSAPTSAPAVPSYPARSARRTLLTRCAWTVWALVPVGILAYHYGPGQAAYRASLATELVAK
ncbi:MAG: hypothetical protein QM516_11950, partial [Limnohabitans sp.]|nr:hypothetical protein [Limnohabitans sp.]